MTADTIATDLRNWILEQRPSCDAQLLDSSTRLIEGRFITSVQVPELVLFIEQLRGSEIDVLALRPGDFATIDAIISVFFAEAAMA